MDVQAPVLILGAAHVHHVGVTGVVCGVCAEVHQHDTADRQDDTPLVIGCRVGQ